MGSGHKRVAKPRVKKNEQAFRSTLSTLYVGSLLTVYLFVTSYWQYGQLAGLLMERLNFEYRSWIDAK